MSKKERINIKRGLAYTLKTRRHGLTTEEAMKIRLLRADPALQPLAFAFDLKESFLTSGTRTRHLRTMRWRRLPNGKQTFPKTYDTIVSEIWLRPSTTSLSRYSATGIVRFQSPTVKPNTRTGLSVRTIMKGRGYSFDTLRVRSLFRRSNLKSILNRGGLYIGPSILTQEPLFTTEALDHNIRKGCGF